MPPYPIEIINFGDYAFRLHEPVIAELNKIQDEVRYCLPRTIHRNWALHLEREQYETSFIWEKLEDYRRQCKGFHPFIIAIVHGDLYSDKLLNLFASCEAEKGLAVVTTKNWETQFAPPPLPVYLAYYFVRYTLGFISPQVKNHDKTLSCFFDKKIHKPDIMLSMQSGKICDNCRMLFEQSVDGFSYESLQKLLSHVKDKASNQGGGMNKPKVFIGSSSEGLTIAESMQLGLEHQAECTIWSQGVFGLSAGTLDSLVSACKAYDYAILVLTPDDVTMKRGNENNTARDNVLFELGLFMGALGRDRTFMVHCRDEKLDLPSDLAGVTAATYGKRTDGNIQAALGPVCTKIKLAMEKQKLNNP